MMYDHHCKSCGKMMSWYVNVGDVCENVACTSHFPQKNEDKFHYFVGADYEGFCRRGSCLTLSEIIMALEEDHNYWNWVEEYDHKNYWMRIYKVNSDGDLEQTHSVGGEEAYIEFKKENNND